MVGPLLLPPVAVLLSPAAPPATHSDPAGATATHRPARSPAPVARSLPQMSSAALHAAAPLRSGCAPAPPHPTALSIAPRPGCCTSLYRALTGPGTTTAPAHVTAATPARATPARAAAPSLSRRRAVLLP